MDMHKQDLASVKTRLKEIDRELQEIAKAESDRQTHADDLFANIRFIINNLHQDDKELQFKMGQRLEGKIDCKPLVYADERLQMAMQKWLDGHFAPYLSMSDCIESLTVLLAKTEEVVFCASCVDHIVRIKRYSKGYWEEYIQEELLPRAQLKRAENELAESKKRYQDKYPEINDSKYFPEYVNQNN